MSPRQSGLPRKVTNGDSRLALTFGLSLPLCGAAQPARNPQNQTPGVTLAQRTYGLLSPRIRDLERSSDPSNSSVATAGRHAPGHLVRCFLVHPRAENLSLAGIVWSLRSADIGEFLGFSQVRRLWLGCPMQRSATRIPNLRPRVPTDTAAIPSTFLSPLAWFPNRSSRTAAYFSWAGACCTSGLDRTSKSDGCSKSLVKNMYGISKPRIGFCHYLLPHEKRGTISRASKSLIRNACVPDRSMRPSPADASLHLRSPEY